MIHDLKISSEFFDDVFYHIKNFEVREKSDRVFSVGDFLRLFEFVNGNFTGRSILRIVTYILDDCRFCKDGYVILSLGDVL